jgi:hypothetical protein
VAEGQPGLIVFQASEEDNGALLEPAWGNSTNIVEVVLELETRKVSGSQYSEESRWIARVQTSTQYSNIFSVQTLSPTVPTITGGSAGVSGHFNGGAAISIDTDSDFNDQGGRWTLLADQLSPSPEKIGIVHHDCHWICAASNYYAQNWNTVNVGARIDMDVGCYGTSFVRNYSVMLQTQKKQGSDTAEECRFVPRLIIGNEGTNVTSIGKILNEASGVDVLAYRFPGSTDIIQFSTDPTMYGGSGHSDTTPKNSNGTWTMIRQALSATGPMGSKQYYLESHWISPSLWFDAKWITG